MEVALTDHWKNFISRLVGSGRFTDANEVIGAALHELEEKEGEVFPPGSLAHLYTDEQNVRESDLARQIRVPEPHEV